MHVCAVLNCAHGLDVYWTYRLGTRKHQETNFQAFLFSQLSYVELSFLSVGLWSFLPPSICRVQTWPGEARIQLPMAHHCSVHVCAHMHKVLGADVSEELVYCWMKECVKNKMSALRVRRLWLGESENLPSLNDLTEDACGWLRLSWLKVSWAPSSQSVHSYSVILWKSYLFVGKRYLSSMTGRWKHL